MAQRRHVWTQREFEELRQAICLHGHTAASARQIFRDSTFGLLQLPNLSLQQIQDKIKSLTKSKVPWLHCNVAVSAPHPANPSATVRSQSDALRSSSGKRSNDLGCQPPQQKLAPARNDLHAAASSSTVGVGGLETGCPLWSKRFVDLASCGVILQVILEYVAACQHSLLHLVGASKDLLQISPVVRQFPIVCGKPIQFFEVGGWRPSRGNGGQHFGVRITDACSGSTLYYEANGRQRWCCGVACMHGRIYAVGGRDVSRVLSNVSVFCMQDGCWWSVNSMSEPRKSPAVLVRRGKLLVIGGDCDYNYLTDAVEEFVAESKVKGTWRSLAAMPHPATGVSAVVCGDTVFAIGGRRYPDEDDFWSSACFRFASDERPCGDYAAPDSQWRTCQPMPTGRAFCAAAARGSTIIVAGGTNCVRLTRRHLPKLDALSIVELYDVSKDSWSALTPLQVPRCMGTAFFNEKTDMLYVFGGAEDMEVYCYQGARSGDNVSHGPQSVVRYSSCVAIRRATGYGWLRKMQRLSSLDARARAFEDTGKLTRIELREFAEAGGVEQMITWLTDAMDTTAVETVVAQNFVTMFCAFLRVVDELAWFSDSMPGTRLSVESFARQMPSSWAALRCKLLSSWFFE
eukprot:TRINITY_DN13662_c0_g1_i2.p1 TRINITY_DN13662_c0_g1~~TRINITY_DN13662_c0_g1_i2.p1  ORF type:complete len:629 (+),score=82.34 TRINITY_DN13662_c0_g1_i2:55-1941(+)